MCVSVCVSVGECGCARAFVHACAYTRMCVWLNTVA